MYKEGNDTYYIEKEGGVTVIWPDFPFRKAWPYSKFKSQKKDRSQEREKTEFRVFAILKIRYQVLHTRYSFW